MRKFRRADCPQFLVSTWEQWGKDWRDRLTQNRGAAFNWRTLDGEKVNIKLLPTLKSQVQDHCSFCDNYPVSPPSNDTIDHFRPKAAYPLEAYKWENLYYCCDFCQGRRHDFDEALLKPDAIDYEFDRYFRWDFTLGKLDINETASAEDKNRADVTIRLFRLNEKHPTLRREALYRRSKMPTDPLDKFPYRHFLEPD